MMPEKKSANTNGDDFDGAGIFFSFLIGLAALSVGYLIYQTADISDPAWTAAYGFQIFLMLVAVLLAIFSLVFILLGILTIVEKIQKRFASLNPDSVTGRAGNLLLSLGTFSLAAVMAFAGYHLLMWTVPDFGMNWIFAGKALLCYMLFSVVIEAGWGPASLLGVSFRCLRRALAIKGNAPSKSREIKNKSVPVAWKGAMFFLGGILLLELVSYGTWGRHFWEPGAASNMIASTDTRKNNETTVSSPAIGSPRVHLIVPRFSHGSDDDAAPVPLWCYVNGRLIHKTYASVNPDFSLQQSDARTYVFNRRGGGIALLLHTDSGVPYSEEEIEAASGAPRALDRSRWKTRGWGHPAFADDRMFHVIPLPLDSGSYDFSILAKSNLAQASEQQGRPFRRIFSKSVDLAPGERRNLYVRPKWSVQAVAMARIAPQFASESARQQWVIEETRRILNQLNDDPLKRALEMAPADTERVRLDLPEFYGGSREYDAEQMAHMRHWLATKYEQLMPQ